MLFVLAMSVAILKTQADYGLSNDLVTGLEPVVEKSQAEANKGFMQNAKIADAQKVPNEADLEQVIATWPYLHERIRGVILKLIESDD